MQPPLCVVLDDDQDDRMMLEDLGDQNAFRVHTTSSYENLMELLDASALNHLPSLLILDLNMPRLTGSEVLGKLKQNPLYQHIPIVILSTSVSAEKSVDLKSRGALGCYTKPSSLREAAHLGRTLKNLLQ